MPALSGHGPRGVIAEPLLVATQIANGLLPLGFGAALGPKR